jgi:hypothetical protein
LTAYTEEVDQEVEKELEIRVEMLEESPAMEASSSSAQDSAPPAAASTAASVSKSPASAPAQDEDEKEDILDMSWTKQELVLEARTRKVKGFSKLNKAQLLTLLSKLPGEPLSLDPKMAEIEKEAQAQVDVEADDEELVLPEQAAAKAFRYTIKVVHDESIFHANDGQADFWQEKDRHSVILPKGRGAGLMVSDFAELHGAGSGTVTLLGLAFPTALTNQQERHGYCLSMARRSKATGGCRT